MDTVRIPAEPEIIVPHVPEQDEVEEWALSVRSKGVVAIVDDSTADLAGERYALLRRVEAGISSIWRPMKDALNRAKAVMLDQERRLLDPVMELRDKQAQEISRWTMERQRQRREEEERLRAEQQRIEEAERKRTVAEMKRAGLKEEAKALAAEPIIPAPVTVATRKIAGVKTVTRYRWEPIDLAKADRKYLTWDKKLIDGMVQRLGARAAEFVGPGSIRVVEDVGVATNPRGR